MRAERNERDFADLVAATGERLGARRAPCVAVSAATLAIGAFGLRLSRTTSDFFVASRVGAARG